jgi:hypothetical protein
MSNARNIASGAKFVDTAGDNITGSLGINNATPSFPLHIKGSTNTNAILGVESANWTTGATAELRLAYTAGYNRSIKGHHDNGLQFFTNPTNPSLQIDNSGRVTMPNQPSFFARGSGNNWVSISNGNRSSPTYATPIFNTGSHFNTSNGRFTAPVNGLYYFMFHPYVKMNSASDSGYYGTTEILVNGNLYNGLETIYGYYNAADYDQVQPVTSIISLSASDYVTTAVQANNADVSFYERGCYFMGYLIG